MDVIFQIERLNHSEIFQIGEAICNQIVISVMTH